MEEQINEHGSLADRRRKQSSRVLSRPSRHSGSARPYATPGSTPPEGASRVQGNGENEEGPPSPRPRRRRPSTVWPEGNRPDVIRRTPRPAMTVDPPHRGRRRANTGFTIRFAKIEVAPIAVSPRTSPRADLGVLPPGTRPKAVGSTAPRTRARPARATSQARRASGWTTLTATTSSRPRDRARRLLPRAGERHRRERCGHEWSCVAHDVVVHDLTARRAPQNRASKATCSRRP